MRTRRLLSGLLLTFTLVTASACGDDSQTGGAGGGTAGAAQGGAADGGSGGHGGEALDPRFNELVESIEAERDAFGAPGVAVAIIEGGEVTFARGFGKKHPDEDDPVLDTTLFRTGSTVKMQTAVALLREVEAGTVDLDAPVTTYVPELEFALDPTWAPSMTPRQLLTHSHGTVDYLKVDVSDADKDDEALGEFFAEFGDIGYVMAPPGRMYNYSNPGYMLAGLVIERASGQSYREYMAEHVWGPLGMTRTVLLPEDVLADGDYAYGKTTHWVSGNPVVAAPDDYDNGWARPAGYAWSDVHDMAAFVKFLRAGNEAVLSDELRGEMTSPQFPTEQLLDLDAYGFGISHMDGAFIGDDFYDLTSLSHTGAINGFSASLDYYPELDFGMVVLSNGDGAYYTDSLDVALRTLTELPAPAEYPDLAVDPATFPTIAGTYLDPYNVGTIIVSVEGNDVLVSMPDLDALNIDYQPKLTPYAPNNFILSVQGTQLLITFLYDEPTQAKYLRTRAFVGVREEAGPKPPASPLAASPSPSPERIRAALARAKSLPPAMRSGPRAARNAR